MASSPTLRIGVIGAGANTRATHLPGLRGLPGVRVDVVANRSEASSRRAAEALGIPRVAADWRAVVDDPVIDAVVIGTWPSLHAQATVAALERGKHVLTEARMARTLAEAGAMLTASKRHPRLVAQVVPAPMSLDVDATVRQLLTEGRLGAVGEVAVTHTGSQYLDPSTPRSWRQDAQASGKNILSLGIVHEIVLRWLDQDPAWVQAEGRIVTPTRPHPETGAPAPVGIPDALTVRGQLTDGARLVYHLSGIEPGPARGEIRLIGDRATLRFDVRTGALTLTPTGAGEQPVEVPPASRRGWRVEADFVDSIRTGAPVRLSSFEDGVRYMRLVEAVWASWTTGAARVPLPRSSA
jgi:predicted dehydrogenase